MLVEFKLAGEIGDGETAFVSLHPNQIVSVEKTESAGVVSIISTTKEYDVQGSYKQIKQRVNRAIAHNK